MCVVLMNNLTEYEGRWDRRRRETKSGTSKRDSLIKNMLIPVKIFRSCAIYIHYPPFRPRSLRQAFSLRDRRRSLTPHRCRSPRSWRVPATTTATAKRKVIAFIEYHSLVERIFFSERVFIINLHCKRKFSSTMDETFDFLMKTKHSQSSASGYKTKSK